MSFVWLPGGPLLTVNDLMPQAEVDQNKKKEQERKAQMGAFRGHGGTCWFTPLT